MITNQPNAHPRLIPLDPVAVVWGDTKYKFKNSAKSALRQKFSRTAKRALGSLVYTGYRPFPNKSLIIQNVTLHCFTSISQSLRVLETIFVFLQGSKYRDCGVFANVKCLRIDHVDEVTGNLAKVN